MAQLTANLLLLVGGVGVLYFGAEWMVRGSARLAVSMGLHPIVVGLTVVSVGTSAPELVVSLVAALSGDPDIAIGNVMGSNLANIGLILGLAAVIRPMSVTRRVVHRDMPLMLAITLFLYPLMRDFQLGRADGLALVGVLVLYLIYVLRADMGQQEATEYEDLEGTGEFQSPRARLRDGGLVFVGATALALGGFAIVESASYVAATFGVSQLAIGVSVVALGTSLPELATSVVASLHREMDIAVGNVIGSNIFNVSAILGITSMATPVSVTGRVLTHEFPLVLFVSLVVWPMSRSGTLQRWQGALLLGMYFAFVFILVRGGL